MDIRRLASLCLVLSTMNANKFGRGFYIPNTKLEINDLGDGFEIFGKQCLKQCIKRKRQTSENMDYIDFQNALQLTSELGTEFSLSTDYTFVVNFKTSIEFLLKDFTLDSLNVKGSIVDIWRATSDEEITLDCLKQRSLSDTFLKDYKQLPDEPRDESDWKMYRDFLFNYGSHILKQLTHGAQFTQYDYTAEVKTVTEEQIEISACLNLELLSSELSMCASYNKTDKESIKMKKIHSQRYLSGGDSSALLVDLTKENLQNFLNVSDDKAGPIKGKFVALWDILKLKFPKRTKNYKKAFNLEAYFKGIHTFGCSELLNGKKQLRRFQLLSTNKDDIPTFACQIAQRGCRVDSDCEYYESICHCKGTTCYTVKPRGGYRYPKQEVLHTRNTYTSYEKQDYEDTSCVYQSGECQCKNGLPKWNTIWSSENPDVLNGERAKRTNIYWM